MWSLFSRDPTTSFSYEIGEAVLPADQRSIFTLHYAKKKECGSPVSVFVCLGSVHNNAELELARSAVRRLKSLKHPCILNYVDSLESDKAVYLVTGPVSPLLSWLFDSRLSEQHRLAVAAWGVRQVLKGINFLNTDGNLEHCNICASSIFVTPGGEWKIFGVEYCRPVIEASIEKNPPPNRLPPSLAVYDAPEKTVDSRRKEMVAWSGDIWGLGCLMWEVFTGAPLMQSGALRNTTKFPASVVPVYKNMLHERPCQRPDCSTVLRQLSGSGQFLDNDIIHIMDFLDDIHIKQAAEKQRFFSSLTERLDSLPDFIVKNKVLPATLSAHQYSDVGSVVLAPLFKMSKLLSESEYQQQVLPSVVQLFSSTDRATRLHLLQQMQHLIVHMDAATVNDKVFPELASGFLDTNPAIRENTVKSVLFLAQKLNRHNLNVEVLKHFARLQSKDEQGGIRTNCTVCLGKVASHLMPATRQKCLISAFTRALQDPFPPARIAGVMALAATQQYYQLDQVSKRILPALCVLTLDREKTVRDAVFRVLRGFLSKLEKCSEDPSLREEMESEVNAASGSGGDVNGARGWAGWAVGTLTSKFYKSSISSSSSGAGGTQQQAKQQVPAAGTDDGKLHKQLPTSAQPTRVWSPPLSPANNAHHLADSTRSQTSQDPPTASGFMQAGAVAEGDAWGEEDDEWRPIENSDEVAGGGEVGDGWQDAQDDWEDLDQAPAATATTGSGTLSLSAVGSGSGSRHSSSNSTAGIIDTPGRLVDSTDPASASWDNSRATKTAAAYKWTANASPDSDDFFAGLSMEKSNVGKTTAPSIRRGRGGGDDGWGAGWEDEPTSNIVSMDSRDAREQKKLERQRLIEAKRAAKGPMKLGTKKT